MSTASITAISAQDAQKYDNPIPNREFILNVLSQQGGRLNREQLAERLKLSSDQDLEALRRRLRAMERDGQILFDRGDYTPINPNELISGRVIGRREGHGFLARDEGGDDLVLGKSQMRKAMDGDRVQVRISGVDHRGRQEAQIVNVLERNTTQLVGRLKTESGVHTLIPDNDRICNEIIVAPESLGDAVDGQYVVVSIAKYARNRSPMLTEVIEVLGDAMAPGMEIDIALRNHDIPFVWPKEAIQAAKKLGSTVSEEDKLHRYDLRSVPLVTIDGEDSMDFDDALFCQPRSNGGWRLFVAIADVSHYVKPGSPLDLEAQKRGTSVYFPGRVEPMLPEALSNGLCSLNPNVDRLAMVCEMFIDSAGNLGKFQFYEGIMRSHARLTYTEVGALLEQPESRLGQQVQQRYSDLVPHLQALHQLYGALRQARSKRGAIDFETTESKFQFDAQRKIRRIDPVVRNDAHKLVEECMLCANVATARFLQKLKLPALYRVHQGPLQKKLESLRAFLGELGLSLGGGKQPTATHYRRLLNSISERPDADVIQSIMLRSLSQAAYSPDNQGHFGLAYSAYAHFTSPIRRYPDLLTHRAIRSVIRGDESGGKLKRALKSITGLGVDPVRRVDSAASLSPSQSYPYNLEEMLKLGEQCSLASRRADMASWDVEAWLKCEYMQDRIGDAFAGTICGVTNFGLFVELKGVMVEGLIHISALEGDYYQFDAAKQRLTGERSKKSYGLGDAIQVRVVRVDLEQRKIELEMDGRWQASGNGKNVSGGRRRSNDKSPGRRSGKPKSSGRYANKKPAVAESAH
ncbi:ribonuclease R [Hahella sp. KA22]|uniref:ribonuclease R n=1 Tax=Hahella sp. KA22 TaxID=1628392 RepID=UPI000FDD9C5E|nr:ribonuclease R [Hahella sp. KA22]AZZ94113.1 ribonuclease R [Hahella sp. KA22]QAY57487.1 ribonuclease R [Hahella sp. KA22]